MAVRLTKPWLAAADIEPRRIPGQLGVFELANEAGEVLLIGAADARSLFGMRSAVLDALESVPAASQYRYEINTAYHTRLRELLMVFVADHGRMPAANPPMRLGTLSPN